MAFKLPNIQLPDFSNIKFPDLGELTSSLYNEADEKITPLMEKYIPSMRPDFKPEDVQPNILKTIDDSKVPDFLKIPAKVLTYMFTDSPEDARKKTEIIDEVVRMKPQKDQAMVKAQLEGPMGFMMLSDDTINKLPTDLQKSAKKYADESMMNMGFASGGLSSKGSVAAAEATSQGFRKLKGAENLINLGKEKGGNLLTNISTKVGKLFEKKPQAATELVDVIPDQNIEGMTEEINKSTQRLVSYDTAKEIAESTLQKYIEDPKNPAFKDDTKRLFKQVGELLHTGELQVDDLPSILKKYDMDSKQFADLYMDTITTSARQLNELSKLKKKMLEQFPELKDQLADIAIEDPGAWSKIGEVFSKIERTRRGLMVSQLGTTARNILSQGGRYTVQFADDVLTGAMEMITGKKVPKDAFMPALQDVLALGRQFSPKKRVELANFISEYPFAKSKLFGTPVGDATFGDKLTSKLNTLNTMQEYFFRRMRMDALINNHVQTKGGEISQAMMNDWVDDALELTFAKTPKGNNFLSQFYQTFNHPFFTAVGNPFPRFWANSIKFLWDFSPLGFTKLISPKFRQELVSQDPRKAYSALSKAVLGSGMFAGAMAIRNSDQLAGEKWYEVRMPNGKTWDTRAYAPFSTYLFLAEAMKPDNNLTGADYAQGLISINRIAGTGLVLVDLLRSKNAETLMKNIKTFAGAYLGGFTVPFRTFKDFIAQYNPGEATYKDTSGAELLGPALENIPFATSGFPTSPRPTRGEPFMREDPIMRQLTGITLKTKTGLEREVDRLGLDYTTLYPRTGEDELDRMITRRVGSVMDVLGEELVKSDSYKKMPDYQKIELLKELYSQTKSVSKQSVLKDSAAQIAAGVYAQIQDLQGEELVSFIRRLENKGLLTDDIANFIVLYKKADVDPAKLTTFMDKNMPMEKKPNILGIPVP